MRGYPPLPLPLPLPALASAPVRPLSPIIPAATGSSAARRVM